MGANDGECGVPFCTAGGSVGDRVHGVSAACVARHSSSSGGAAIITGVAFLVSASLTVSMKASGAPITFTSKSLYFVVVVGVAAACADLFTLSAYARGLKITSSFVIGGTSTALVLLIGFVLLKEPFTWLKLLAIGLIVAGIGLLQREGL
jgi:drug/metabolite transporter (DMT)-like permease